MKRNTKIGKHNIPLWVIVVLLISVISMGVLADYVWRTITLSVEVKEPLEIVSYPSKLTLFPGETEEFNVTVMNHASRNYTVILDFSLDNTTYQTNYVTFSDEIYNVIPGQQDLLAWLKVESYAPTINASLTIDFRRIAEVEGELLFFDDFNDGVADGWTEHLGTWIVVNGEYFVTVGLLENGISTVNKLDLDDCIIETTLRFKDTSVGFKAGIMFRYTDNEHYYNFVLSNEYDNICLDGYDPAHANYGFSIAHSGEGVHMIQPNTDYLLKIVIQGNTFTCFFNGEEMFSGIDDDYTAGKVGLWARYADVFFDDFKVTEIS